MPTFVTWNMQAAAATGGPDRVARTAALARLADAWSGAHPARPHAPTVGLHDDAPGAGPPFTFDYAFVGADLARRVRGLHVDAFDTGSAHQPLVLELDLGHQRGQDA